MYEIITEIIGQVGDQEYVVCIAGALICLLVVVIVDFIRDIFCGFFRG